MIGIRKVLRAALGMVGADEVAKARGAELEALRKLSDRTEELQATRDAFDGLQEQAKAFAVEADEQIGALRKRATGAQALTIEAAGLLLQGWREGQDVGVADPVPAPELPPDEAAKAIEEEEAKLRAVAQFVSKEIDKCYPPEVVEHYRIFRRLGVESGVIGREVRALIEFLGMVAAMVGIEEEPAGSLPDGLRLAERVRDRVSNLHGDLLLLVRWADIPLNPEDVAPPIPSLLRKLRESMRARADLRDELQTAKNLLAEELTTCRAFVPSVFLDDGTNLSEGLAAWRDERSKTGTRAETLAALLGAEVQPGDDPSMVLARVLTAATDLREDLTRAGVDTDLPVAGPEGGAVGVVLTRNRELQMAQVAAAARTAKVSDLAGAAADPTEAAILREEVRRRSDGLDGVFAEAGIAILEGKHGEAAREAFRGILLPLLPGEERARIATADLTQ